MAKAERESEGPTDEIVRVRRRQSRSADTRARILEAAIAEFADHGFNGATTRLIADRAEVRHALVIYHFQTKLGIWQAAMTEVLDDFHNTFAARLDGLRGVDDVTKLRLLHADFIRRSAARPELHWLMSHEAGQPGERINWIVDNLLSHNFATFTQLIKSAQRSGQYVEGDPLHLHYIFLGAAARIFMLSSEVQQVMGRSPYDEDFIDEHVAACERLFFRAAPTRSKSKLKQAVSDG